MCLTLNWCKPFWNWVRVTVEAPVMQRTHPDCLPLEKWNPLRPSVEQVTPPPGHHKAQPQQKYTLVYRPCVLGTGAWLPNTIRRLLSDASRQPSLTKGPSSASAVASASGNAQLSVGDLHPADVPDAGPRGSHHRREEVFVWWGLRKRKPVLLYWCSRLTLPFNLVRDFQ